MKKLLLTALLTMLCILCAPAQQPGTKPYKEPRVRFGAGYRYSLGVAEKYKATYQSDSGTDKAVSPWGTPDNMRGGELRLEMTIRITPDWNVGAGWGMGMYDKDDWRSQLIYVKAERLYGKRPSRWFNYAELGTYTADMALDILETGTVPEYHVMDGGIITVNTETAAALDLDYSAFNDLAGTVVEVETTAE